MIEYLQNRDGSRILKDEIKKLKEQLQVAVRFGNKLCASGVPLMARSNSYRKDEACKDFGKLSAEWWQFVAATKALRDAKHNSKSDLEVMKGMLDKNNIKNRVYVYSTFTEINVYEKGINLYFQTDGRFASLGVPKR